MQCFDVTNSINNDNNLSIFCEGVNRSDTRIVETNHPYERGKIIKFEPIHFDNQVSCLEI